MKRLGYQLFFLLSTIEGIIALLFLFWIPSMEKNSTLLGYSPIRLVFGVVIFIPLASLFWFTYKIFFVSNYINQIDQSLHQWLIRDKLFIPVCVALSFAILSGGVCLYLYYAPVSQHLGMLISVIERMMSLIIWIIILAFQLLVIIFTRFLSSYRHITNGSIDYWLLFNSILAPLMIITSIAHWAVYYFRLELFINIPDWFWKFQTLPWGWRDALFLLILGISIVVVWKILRNPSRIRLNLILVVILGVILQIGFGFIEGDGMESVRQKYALTDHSTYARQAVNQPDLIKTLTDYESLYGEDYYLGTKPPGIMVVYSLAQKISNIIQAETTNYEMYLRLTWFIAYTFPWFACLVLFLMFFLSSSFLKGEDIWLPGILYIFCVNFILMPLFMDQVLYPFLFVACLLFVVKAVNQRSIYWGIAAGVVIYLSLFITFSLAPVVPLVILWIGIEYVLPYFSIDKEKKLDLLTVFKIVLGLAVGWLVMMILFKYLLNYDFLTRYSTALAQHRDIRHFYPGIRQIIDAMILNNTEFGVWTGFPIILLFLSRLVKTVVAYVRRTACRLDSLMVAFIATFMALNLFGQTKGEVGRLWIFLLPLVALFAADEIKNVFSYLPEMPGKHTGKRIDIRKLVAVLMVICLQLMSTMIIYKCQNLNGLLFIK